MAMEESSSSYSWSWEEEKAFENAVAVYTEDSDDRWEKIAANVPMKTIEQIMHHYQLLEEDVGAIESGLIPLPNYPSSKTTDESAINDGSSKKSGQGNSHESSKGSRLEQERRKGIAWSEEEHRLFLLGLEKYGKGDWRSISRNFVVTRTPTQVASHAQKFFIRLNSGNKDRRRSSIHDITTVGDGDAPAVPQTNATLSKTVNSVNQLSDQSAEPHGVGPCGTAIGHPVVSGLVTAIGTPVIIPVPGAVMQMGYGVRTPVTAETVVPEDPVNFPIQSRSTPRKSSRR
ncbi:transcription factor SRM1-like [Phalaenopsis equestris]|uniref:transcription factor SRM1-like n=1 Tax=Phalaenopsis equestris TaxID=78828 RepID=UPI0009E64698|nr:transcription factor SRM1-like [Phalaenopsis equestris]